MKRRKVNGEWLPTEGHRERPEEDWKRIMQCGREEACSECKCNSPFKGKRNVNVKDRPSAPRPSAEEGEGTTLQGTSL